MAMTAKQLEYVNRVIPIAKEVSRRTGIAPELIVSWWSWETNYGANETHKVNNHSGIKSASTGKDFVAGQYAGYNSSDSYVADYVRMITSRDYRGYGKIIDVAKANPKNYVEVTKAHNASMWSEADYNVTTIASRANEVAKLLGVVGGTSGGGGSEKKSQSVKCPSCSASLHLSL